ncbi:hypothetical protein AUTU_26970 [Aureibacter tunicatorum]|nr:hypothetical protein AUTU_26970 [Aureibacter tunicatorum]
MFYTDDTIQTSFTTEEILAAIFLFLAATAFFLYRIRSIRNQSGKSFNTNFLKFFIPPFIFAVGAIFYESEILNFFSGQSDNQTNQTSSRPASMDSNIVISEISGNNLYHWNGKSLKTPSGKPIITYTNHEYQTPSGKTLLKWENDCIVTPSGKKLFEHKAGKISQINGPSLFKIEMDKVSKISGNNILSINKPYEIPREVVIFATLHYLNQL